MFLYTRDVFIIGYFLGFWFSGRIWPERESCIFVACYGRGYRHLFVLLFRQSDQDDPGDKEGVWRSFLFKWTIF